MNAAEEIVKYWYQSKGYFVMESVRLPRGREIDLLAIRLADDNKTVIDKLHIEVQVSNNFTNFKLTAQNIAEQYHLKKFLLVQEAVRKIIGENYRMIEVRGKMAFGKADIRSEYMALRKKSGVEIIPFEEILKEILESLPPNIQSNPVMQALQYLKYQESDHHSLMQVSPVS